MRRQRDQTRRRRTRRGDFELALGRAAEGTEHLGQIAGEGARLVNLEERFRRQRRDRDGSTLLKRTFNRPLLGSRRLDETQSIDGKIPAKIRKQVLGVSKAHDEPHSESTERSLEGAYRLEQKADSMVPGPAKVLDEVEMIPGIEDPDRDRLVVIRIEELEERLVVNPELAAEPEKVPAAPRRRRRRLARSVVETSIVVTQGHSRFPAWSRSAWPAPCSRGHSRDRIHDPPERNAGDPLFRVHAGEEVGPACRRPPSGRDDHARKPSSACDGTPSPSGFANEKPARSTS